MTRTTSLFSNGHLSDSLGHNLREIEKAIEAWNEDDLLRQPEGDIVETLVEKFSVVAPVLDKANITQEPITETYVDAIQFRERVKVKHTLITLVIPYTGEGDVFKLRPGSFGFHAPSGTVTPTALKIQWSGPAHETSGAKQGLDNELAHVERCLAAATQQIEQFNRQAATHAAEQVRRRKATILAHRNLEASIGYPVSKRTDAASYTLPIRRRKINLPQRPSSTQPFRPEPTFEDTQYEEALRVLTNARNGLERNPTTTAKMGEEEIRNLLLIALNSQFEGAAAGEVFNASGKTDILIRVEDRHIFIGECKIWHGQQAFTEAIDQLLTYLTWRDTKAALLLFIRTGTLSDIAPKALAALRSHPNFKRAGTHDDLGERHDVILHAKDDPAREIKVAFMPFVLPK